LRCNGWASPNVVRPTTLRVFRLCQSKIFLNRQGAEKTMQDTIETQVMTITPVVAQKWLDGATDFKNRPIKEGVILKYSRDMANGVWQMNGETMKFARRNNGSAVMIDGQHRALACIRSGNTFQSLVIFGIDESTYTSMDSGSTRQPADFLSRSGHQYVHPVIAAARMSFAHKAGGNPTVRGRGSSATNQEILDIVAGAPELEDSAVAIYNIAGGHSKLLAPSISVYLYYRFGQIDADWRDLFFEGLYHGAGLKSKSPILLLRTRLIDNLSASTKLTPTVKTALVIKAWNAFISGRDLRLLRWSGSGRKKEKFPAIEALPPTL
jgi:hypothetical protein